MVFEGSVLGGENNTERETWRVTHHPGFAAEVVDGEERVNTGNSTVLQTHHQIPEVFSWRHAVGMLTNQNKIWLERSGKTNNISGEKTGE